MYLSSFSTFLPLTDILVKGKGKVHPISCHEGPEGE